MKRIILLISLLAVMLTALFAQNTELPRLGVVAFSTNINNEKTKADAISVRNLVESQMIGTRKYHIITREEIDKLLDNQRIQVSSISSAENIKKLQLQNISYIVTGSVDAMGNDYTVTVKILDVATGQFSHSDNDFMGSTGRDLYNGINGLMTKFVAGMSSEEGKVIQTGQQQNRVKYKIGDTGPGGGIVFVIEGNTGMEVSRLLGDYNWDDAIQTAKDYRGGNFNDWHLPSISEFVLIFQNLQKNGIVNLRTTIYWSSEQGRDNNYAYLYKFTDEKDISLKRSLLSVRAVRAF
jgi:TolB-like protein